MAPLAPLLDRIHPEPPYSRGRFVPLICVGAIATAALIGLAGLAESTSKMMDDAGTCITVTEPGAGCGVFR